MKTDTIKIGEECSVGNMSVVLYGTEMAPRAVLGPLSVLMKGERLPEASRWAGIPTQPDNAEPQAQPVAGPTDMPLPAVA